MIGMTFSGGLLLVVSQDPTLIRSLIDVLFPAVQ